MNRMKIAALALMLLAGAPSANAQSAAVARPELVRVRYMVADVPASVAFYSGKLGFKIDFQSGPYFAALSRGGVQLLLSPAKGPGGASQPMPNGDKPVPGGWNRLVLNTPVQKSQSKLNHVRSRSFTDLQSASPPQFSHTSRSGVPFGSITGVSQPKQSGTW